MDGQKRRKHPPNKMNSNSMSTYTNLLNQINGETMRARAVLITAPPDMGQQLRYYEMSIGELVKSLHAVRESDVRSFDIIGEVRKLAPTNAKWQALVDNDMVDNIAIILDDCYDPLCEEYPKAAREVLGEMGSLKWKTFLLRVIKYLKDGDSFHQEGDESLSTFDDTAGGCDEIVWDAACTLLQRSIIQKA